MEQGKASSKEVQVNRPIAQKVPMRSRGRHVLSNFSTVESHHWSVLLKSTASDAQVN